MRRLTQTDVDHGNCWQYGVACVLELDPETMPDQVALEDDQKRGYHNALNEYLVRHHRMMYFELHDWQFPSFTVHACDGYHLLVGPTVRTPSNDMNHVVVGRYGNFVWDPHPSRAGLTRIERWGIVGPVPQGFIDQRNENKKRMPDSYRCFCPACGGE